MGCLIKKLLSRSRPAVRAECVQELGARCPDVVFVQRQLNKYGKRYGIPRIQETGIYDEATRHAMRLFQAEALGMDSDGFIGPQTARRLHIQLEESPLG